MDTRYNVCQSKLEENSFVEQFAWMLPPQSCHLKHDNDVSEEIVEIGSWPVSSVQNQIRKI